MQRSWLTLILSMIFSASTFPQEQGVIRCEDSDAKVSAWTAPDSAFLVDNLLCGQSVSLLALERGFYRIQIGEKFAYVDAKYVRAAAPPISENQGTNPGLPQSRKSDQADIAAPARIFSDPGPLPAARGDKPLRRNATIYIEEMEGDLDGFIRAEMVKRHVPLEILLSPEKAHYILTGTLVIQEKRAWHEGWLSAEKDHNVANIMVMDPRANKMLWASEAGDRSWWWGAMKRGGQRKTAERLVNNLKKAID